jgi:hypothetical protein
MKKHFIILLLVVGLSATMNSQDIFHELQLDVPGEGKITITQDESIKTLVLARIAEIKNEQKIPGFRINIFYDDSQNSYEKAMQVRSKFMAKYSYNCEYVYEAPDSKLYIGNFRTKSEAQKALLEILNDYPKAYQRPAKIDLPDLE